MIVGVSGQVQSINVPKATEVQPRLAAESGHLVPQKEISETVNISEAGKFQLQKEMGNIREARESGEFVDTRGREGKIRLGLMVLGKDTVDGWTAKGLKLTEESVLAAADAFQQGFQKNVENYGSSTAGSSVAINRHKIVMNSQAVPDWFVREYEQNLSSMGDQDVREAFKNGDTFFASAPPTSKSEALNRYIGISSAL